MADQVDEVAPVGAEIEDTERPRHPPPILGDVSGGSALVTDTASRAAASWLLGYAGAWWSGLANVQPTSMAFTAAATTTAAALGKSLIISPAAEGAPNVTQLIEATVAGGAGHLVMDHSRAFWISGLASLGSRGLVIAMRRLFPQIDFSRFDENV